MAPHRHDKRPDRMGLPYRPFFYTLDQITDLFQLENLGPILFYDGRSPGICPDNQLLAINITPGSNPTWRVEEQELLRWMRVMGFVAHVRVNRLR